MVKTLTFNLKVIGSNPIKNDFLSNVNSGSPYFEMHYSHLQIWRWKWRMVGAHCLDPKSMKDKKKKYKLLKISLKNPKQVD